jgi:hypothetical protein
MDDIYDDFFKESNLIKNKIFGELPEIDETCSHVNTRIIKGNEVCDSCGSTLKKVETANCKHGNIIIIEDNEVCVECGAVVQDLEESEWKADGPKNISDPMRCHKRKSGERTIYKDVENMEFPDIIVKSANKKYQEIIKNNIYRGAKRKAIIVACLFYSYIEHGEFRTSDEISRKFNIKKKSVKEGFAKYCETFPHAATQYIDAKDLIKQIMIRTNINFSHLRKINKLCEYLENKSQLLNRSNPQSVAAAIVYLYLCLESEYKDQIGMTKLKFANIVNLSDITITKLGKESQRIIKNDTLKI